LPTKEEHTAKAEGNAAFALSLPLENQAKTDWALIALFYAAMHYVEAYLSTIGQHLRGHTTRDNAVGRDSNPRKIYHEYQDLKYYGYNARYEVCGFKPTDVTDIAAGEFAAIKTQIMPLL
jgi:hypothetical protein